MIEVVYGTVEVPEAGARRRTKEFCFVIADDGRKFFLHKNDTELKKCPVPGMTIRAHIMPFKGNKEGKFDRLVNAQVVQ